MSQTRPVVAVGASRLSPGRVGSWTDGAEAVPAQYLDGLRRAGLIPVVVAPDAGGDLAGLLGRFDGLVLTGGPDLDPAAYGEAAHPAVYGVDAERDRRELEMAAAAVEAGVVTLAVCRGAQVLNVALGGTLVQHLPDLATDVAHGVPVGAGEPAVHPVDVEPGSRLAELTGGRAALPGCVSIHHQAVGRVGEGLVVTARAADGVIEAVEPPPGRPWCLAVQWHPERSAATDPGQQAVFDGFAAAVAAAAAGR